MVSMANDHLLQVAVTVNEDVNIGTRVNANDQIEIERLSHELGLMTND